MYFKKSFGLVLTEAFVVGICLVILVYFVKQFVNFIPNLSGYRDNIEFYIIVGMLFHVLFEYSGLNLWYSKEYCKLLE
jgi:uncharacterized membrane protein YedE/YeeE